MPCRGGLPQFGRSSPYVLRSDPNRSRGPVLAAQGLRVPSSSSDLLCSISGTLPPPQMSPDDDLSVRAGIGGVVDILLQLVQTTRRLPPSSVEHEKSSNPTNNTTEGRRHGCSLRLISLSWASIRRMTTLRLIRKCFGLLPTAVITLPLL